MLFILNREALDALFIAHREAKMLPYDKDDGPFFRVSVLRETTLEDAIVKVSMTKQEDFRKKLHVTFRFEAGVDDGGPSREFASLIVKDLAQSKYVRGPESGKSFARHHDGLTEGDFQRIGSLVSITTINGGFGMPIFTRPVAEYIVYGEARSRCSIEDVPDAEMKRKLLQVCLIIT